MCSHPIRDIVASFVDGSRLEVHSSALRAQISAPPDRWNLPLSGALDQRAAFGDLHLREENRVPTRSNHLWDVAEGFKIREHVE